MHEIIHASEQLREELSDAIADKVRKRRKALAMSQESMAALIGVSDGTMLRIEAGQHHMPAWRLFALGVALQIPVGDIYREYAEKLCEHLKKKN